RLAPARALLEEALDRWPRAADLHNTMGTLALRERQPDSAATAFARALELDPNLVPALINMGDLLLGDRDYRQSAEYFRRAQRVDPNSKSAAIGLARALSGLGQFDGAREILETILKRTPDDPPALDALGQVFQAAGDLDSALRFHAKACDCAPGHPEYLHNYAVGLFNAGRLEQAVSLLNEILHNQRDAISESLLASALIELRNYDGARQVIQQWEDVSSEKLAAWLCFGERTAAWPADWETQRQRALSLLREGKPARQPFEIMRLPGATTDDLALAARLATEFPGVEKLLPQFREDDTPRDSGRPLRVGYLSHDFRDHATSWLFARVPELHRQDKVFSVGLSLSGRDEGHMQTRLREGFSEWHDLSGMSDVALAQKVRDVGVDILVDMMGLVRNSRPRAMAMRMAPVQVNYLGYPGPVSRRLVDYNITDNTIVAGLDGEFDEARAVLSRPYFPIDLALESRDLKNREDYGLPAESVILGSFHQGYKITPEVFKSWCCILTRVPNSVLWLLADHPIQQANLLDRAESLGVSRDRIVFATEAPHAEHLARLGHVDLALDTWPVNGHTTSIDLLTQAVPVLTIRGQTPPGRVGESLLTSIELDSMVAETADHYVALAVGLASDLPRLRSLRDALRGAREERRGVYNVEALVHQLECAYGIMWARYRQGDAPKTFDVTD
ncbi:MAG: tetratricopeptide repeat protein, partial [Halothiobacillaceae bacterium]